MIDNPPLTPRERAKLGRRMGDLHRNTVWGLQMLELADELDRLLDRAEEAADGGRGADDAVSTPTTAPARGFAAGQAVEIALPGRVDEEGPLGVAVVCEDALGHRKTLLVEPGRVRALGRVG